MLHYANVTGPAKTGHVAQTTPCNLTGYFSVMEQNICAM